ncbi:MAG: lipopolysaccharide biosynthesis protein [Christensenellales bacterium]
MRERLRARFLGNGESLGRKTYLWTVVSGLMFAGSSVIMLWAVTHIVGVDEGGVFSIAFAVSQQMLSLGWYCMRAFQASDVQNMYAFKDYFASRVITVGLMLLAGVGWVVISGYDWYKAAVTLIFCLYRSCEAFSDVFEGLYQQRGRYDLSAKGLFFKYFIAVLSFICALYYSHNLILATCILTVSYLAVILVYDASLVGVFEPFELQFRFGHLRRLLIACLPLCVCLFISGYVNNAAKYAIDAYMDYKTQTYFNILFMPASVINLFASFLIKPQLSTLANQFQNGQMKPFFKNMARQMLYVLVITVGCMTIGYFLGIPVLSWVYGVNLTGYRGTMLILLGSGGVSAMYNVFYYCITIMRKQYALLIGYGIAFVASIVSMPYFVQHFGINGAAWGYFGIIVMLNLLFAGTMCFFLIKIRKNGGPAKQKPAQTELP